MNHLSLNERAKNLKLAIDMPAVNRSARRRDLRNAVREEKRARRKSFPVMEKPRKKGWLRHIEKLLIFAKLPKSKQKPLAIINRRTP